MLSEEHLFLRLVRLRQPEEWTIKGEGLALLFPKEGVGKLTSSACTVLLAPGDVLVVSAATEGKLSVVARDDLVFASFCLRFEHLGPLLAPAEICQLQRIADRFADPKLYPAATPFASECHRIVDGVPSRASLSHRIELLRVAAAILNSEFDPVALARSRLARPNQHIIRVFERLSSDDLMTLSVGELASRFGCSRRHLNRVFQQHFGLSVATLRMEMRLLKAVSLLRDPNTKVGQVAEECGFNSPSLFHTCFRRRFGTSPGQWAGKAMVQKQATGPTAGDTACPLRLSGVCPWLDGSIQRPEDTRESDQLDKKGQAAIYEAAGSPTPVPRCSD
ncbi:hypothetical protein SBV1_3130004 [Verrucomicrobia bacterium]|nr:hypothetical protein SBV1_3130004 [Verrucomicrobiota bacterium]